MGQGLRSKIVLMILISLLMTSIYWTGLADHWKSKEAAYKQKVKCGNSWYFLMLEYSG